MHAGKGKDLVKDDFAGPTDELAATSASSTNTSAVRDPNGASNGRPPSRPVHSRTSPARGNPGSYEEHIRPMADPMVSRSRPTAPRVHLRPANEGSGVNPTRSSGSAGATTISHHGNNAEKRRRSPGSTGFHASPNSPTFDRTKSA